MRSSTLLALIGASTVSAWGTLGHDTVALIASNFVKSSTKAWAQGILNDTSANYLANVATWADSYRYTAAGRFTAPYHYIDAEDNPPSSCNVDYDRDCGASGCLVSAIANYTQRVQSSSLYITEVNYALRFLVHFLGDITQPLHNEAIKIGGNDIDVTYKNKTTNLHHIWDSEMPEQLRGGYALTDAQAWANAISNDIKGGKYKTQAKTWIKGARIKDAISTATGWASDANVYVCSKVMPNGYEVLETSDLSGDYYKGVIDTIELQIAKGGYRLADWLDQLAAASKTKKSVARAAAVDLSGGEFLPAARELSRAKMARMEAGFDCKHPH